MLLLWCCLIGVCCGSVCELVFCSCSGIPDPRQVDSLVILVASFPLLVPLRLLDVWVVDFVEAGELLVLVNLE